MNDSKKAAAIDDIVAKAAAASEAATKAYFAAIDASDAAIAAAKAYDAYAYTVVDAYDDDMAASYAKAKRTALDASLATAKTVSKADAANHDAAAAAATAAVAKAYENANRNKKRK